MQLRSDWISRSLRDVRLESARSTSVGDAPEVILVGETREPRVSPDTIVESSLGTAGLALSGELEFAVQANTD